MNLTSVTKVTVKSPLKALPHPSISLSGMEKQAEEYEWRHRHANNTPRGDECDDSSGWGDGDV
eukprot:1336874-Amorphochlora_amoeboformis.AAC.1